MLCWTKGTYTEVETNLLGMRRDRRLTPGVALDEIVGLVVEAELVGDIAEEVVQDLQRLLARLLPRQAKKGELIGEAQSGVAEPALTQPSPVLFG